MGREVTTEPIMPSAFAHFVIRVSDKARSVEWYGKVLGMQVVHENPMIAFMTYDDEHHRMALVQMQGDEKISKTAPGMDHVAYTLNDLGELLGTYKRLKAEGIDPVWPINHGLTTSIYYEDPDGMRVEFQVENFPTKEELQGFMRSDAFANNPIGVNFDPEELLERYEKGEAMEALLAQGTP